MLRCFSLPIDSASRKKIAAMLQAELGTDDLSRAETYMEEALRTTLHVILSLPAYQLG